MEEISRIQAFLFQEITHPSGSGSGSGYGYGSGYGSGIKSVNHYPVFSVDGVLTAFQRIHKNLALAFIVREDLSFDPCYVIKGGGFFAHGRTLREAQAALQEKLLEDMPEEERMTLHTDFNKEVEMEGNLSLIGSIFRNLTENAIAYSGGKNIYISLISNTEDMCHIRFEDDGKGVEQKQLPHLFERFYRVDKSHSKQSGGTGLGLSIVKHAVQYHHGRIILESEQNKGTTVSVILSK